MDNVGDKDAIKVQLEKELAELETLFASAPMQILRQDLQEQEESLINLLCNTQITDIGTFFSHFEAVGHLRGIRQTKATFVGAIEEIKQKLSEL